MNVQMYECTCAYEYMNIGMYECLNVWVYDYWDVWMYSCTLASGTTVTVKVAVCFISLYIIIIEIQDEVKF